MNNKRVEIFVGLFVVLGLVALLVLALQVSGLGDFYSTKQGYTVKAAFTNIGGLKVRARVTIGGVTVGRVTSIELVRNNYQEYEALVELSIDNRVAGIPSDSTAKILTAGLLGDNYIGIVPGQAEQSLEDGSTIELTSQAVLLEDLIAKFVTNSR